MSEVAKTSFNDVRNGVISTLDQWFPEKRIYGEEISQGFQEPCFFVKIFPSSEKRIVGNRFKRFHAFDIHYFSDAVDVNDDFNDMAEQLYTVLEYITVNGDLYTGTQMEHEIVDNVLHFFVHFNVVVYKEQPPVPLMESLALEWKRRMKHDGN